MTSPSLAIITGAGRGIGRAIAQVLSQNGFRCILIARSKGQLDETARLLPRESESIVCDLHDPAQITSAIDRIKQKYNRIDLLVNNAGVAPLVPFEQTTPAIWDEVFAINVRAVYQFCHSVWPIMVEQKSGVIINISSEASRDPYPGFSAYAPSKAAINMFTRVLAKEGDRHNIRVHAVAPAGVETGMLRAIADEKLLPRDQTLDPEHVAETVMGCVSGALKHTSGETIFVHRRMS